MNRRGASLVEAVVALAVLGLGVGAVAGVTGGAARALARARALDDAHAALASFVDSVSALHGAGSGSDVGQGRLALDWGELSWEFAAPGSVGWVRAEHRALPSPVEIEFALPADSGRTVP